MFEVHVHVGKRHSRALPTNGGTYLWKCGVGEHASCITYEAHGAVRGLLALQGNQVPDFGIERSTKKTL